MDLGVPQRPLPMIFLLFEGWKFILRGRWSNGGSWCCGKQDKII